MGMLDGLINSALGGMMGALQEVLGSGTIGQIAQQLGTQKKTG